MRVDFIRHGECDDDVFLRGRTDSLLSSLGRRQMQQAIADLPKPDFVLSSPSQRSLNFARDNFEDVQVLHDLAERDFGDWDGVSFQTLQKQSPQQLDEYLQNPFADVIPNSESLPDFQQRITQVWQKLCAMDAQHLFVFSHSGVQRILLKSILGFPNKYLFNLRIDYAARMTFEVTKTQQGYFTQLVEIRQHQHF